MCDPLKSMRLCTRNKSVRICVVSWVLSVAYNVITGVLKLVIYQHLSGELQSINVYGRKTSSCFVLLRPILLVSEYQRFVVSRYELNIM